MIISQKELEKIKLDTVNNLLEEIANRADKVFGYSFEAAIGKAYTEIVCKYANKK